MRWYAFLVASDQNIRCFRGREETNHAHHHVVPSGAWPPPWHTITQLPVSPAPFIPAYAFLWQVFHSAVPARRALTNSVSEVVDPSGMAVEPCSGGKVRSGETYIHCHLRRANTHRACNGRGVEPDIVVEEGEREEGRDIFGWDSSFPWSHGPVRMVGMVMWGPIIISLPFFQCLETSRGKGVVRITQGVGEKTTLSLGIFASTPT